MRGSNRLSVLVIKVGAVAESFFERHAVAPFCDFSVVAANEDLGNFPTAIVGGASVVGKIEQGTTVRERFVQRAGLRFFGALEQAEGFVLRRSLVAEGSRK